MISKVYCPDFPVMVEMRMVPVVDPVNWLEQHGDALYAYCLMRVREPSTAEDLVQETLLAALKSVAGFKGQSTERTWLIGILKHKILDYLRKSTREQPLDENSRPAEGTDIYFDQTGHWQVKISDWEQPEKSLEQEQFWMTFNDCVGKLPERLRQLYALHELDDVDTDEIIKTLKISSRNNVWVMLSRARVHLRQCLETNWYST